MEEIKHERKVHHDFRALFEPRTDPRTNSAMPQLFVQCGNPAVEVIPGCLYLAGSFESKEVKEEQADNSSERKKHRRTSRKSVKQEEAGSPVELCIHIPAGMTIAEVYGFLASFERCILYAQVMAQVDDPDFYVMLLQLRTLEDALAFSQECHMQPYNSMEESVCKVTPVSSAEFRMGKTVVYFPVCKEEEVCAVCLEAIEEGGMITTLCNHVFHFACLSKWADSTCPVCRYSMQPNVNSACHVCGVSSPAALWMCLMCGHIGCGRYNNGHAKEHFEAFNHACALEVTTQRVWDYSSDQYVHRIAQNVKDGKMVALGRKDQFEEEVDAGIKLEQLLVEYNYLLSSELEKQRAFFVAQMNFKQAELLALKEPELQKDEELTRLSQQLQKRAQCLEKALVTGEKVQLVELARKKEAAKEKDAKLRSLNTRLLSQQSKMREGFEGRQQSCQQEQDKELRALDEQQKQLEDELNDLKFYLKTQKQIGSSPFKGELASAHVIVMGGPQEQKKGRRTKQKGKH